MFGVLAMRALGGLLLLAAALKLYGLSVEPVGGVGIFSEPWLQTLIVEWEIALGIWLVWGVNRRLAWLAATATFLAFAGFSFWQGWVGQTSCGCFGAIRVNPWIAFAFDMVALLILVVSRGATSRIESETALSKSLSPIAMTAGSVAVLLGLFAAIGTFSFGSLDAALAYFRGERLSIRPQLVDMGTASLGESRQVKIEFKNWTDAPIRIVGGTSDCSCVVTHDLPILIASGESQEIALLLRFTGGPGMFTRTAELFTDDGQLKVTVHPKNLSKLAQLQPA